MKSKNKIFIIAVISCVCGIGLFFVIKFHEIGSKKDNVEELRKEDVSKYIPVQLYNGRNIEKIKESISDLPTDYQKAVQYRLPYQIGAILTNRDMIWDFYQKVKKGKKAVLCIGKNATEGGILYDYYQYNGKDIFQYDNVNENISDNGTIFQHISILQIPEKVYDVDYSKLPEKYYSLIFSQKKVKSYEEYEKLSDQEKSKTMKYTLVPFVTEKEVRYYIRYYTGNKE